eukprot:3384129-Heterocapsa_arctica.AAC.1
MVLVRGRSGVAVYDTRSLGPKEPLAHGLFHRRAFESTRVLPALFIPRSRGRRGSRRGGFSLLG